MELVIYSVLDRRLREYGPLVTVQNEYAMQRMIRESVRVNPESLLARYPEDFDVYEVGRFDVRTGGVSGQVNGGILVAQVVGILNGGGER